MDEMFTALLVDAKQRMMYYEYNTCTKINKLINVKNNNNKQIFRYICSIRA